MPFRTKAVLERWLSDFANEFPGVEPYVAQQEALNGGDDGLVVLPLRKVTTVAFLQPAKVGSSRWLLTFEAQPEITELDGVGLRDLAGELMLAAELCDFLQARAREFLDAPTRPST